MMRNSCSNQTERHNIFSIQLNLRSFINCKVTFDATYGYIPLSLHETKRSHDLVSLVPSNFVYFLFACFHFAYSLSHSVYSPFANSHFDYSLSRFAHSLFACSNFAYDLSHFAYSHFAYSRSTYPIFSRLNELSSKMIPVYNSPLFLEITSMFIFVSPVYSIKQTIKLQ